VNRKNIEFRSFETLKRVYVLVQQTFYGCLSELTSHFHSARTQVNKSPGRRVRESRSRKFSHRTVCWST